MNMNKKQIISWCMYDFANSSYWAVILAVVFPVYYAKAIVGNETGAGDQWWGRAISLSMFIVALTSPFLGGIADYAGRKKLLLAIYTSACVAAVASFSILSPGMVMAGFVLIVLANIGAEGGLVFYNSFLPRIASPEYQGRVSGWGYGVGYAGSILSLVIAIPLVKAEHIEYVWFMTAAFFALFSLPAFMFLPKDRPAPVTAIRSGLQGVKSAWATIREISQRKDARKFLLAYLIYEDGVNTVIVFSSIFAATTFSFSPKELIGLYLIVQFTALAGAFIIARPIDTMGPKKIVTLSLLFWILVSITAYFARTKGQFWLVAVIAGLGLGTVQAGTRAFFTQFVLREKEAEYFGVYSLVGKTSAVFGPLVFGEISAAFNSQRPAILSIAAFFIAGLAILSRVKGGGPNIKAGQQDI